MNRSPLLRHTLSGRQRAAILRAAKSAETVVIPHGRPRDEVSAYTYSTGARDECWYSIGRLSNHACDCAGRLIEMQLKRQVREGRALPERLSA
jgi:hypothetical protein